MFGAPGLADIVEQQTLLTAALRGVFNGVNAPVPAVNVSVTSAEKSAAIAASYRRRRVPNGFVWSAPPA